MESKIKDYLEEELGGLANKEKGMEIENKATEIEIRVPKFKDSYSTNDFYDEEKYAKMVNRLHRYYKNAIARGVRKYYNEIARDFDVLRANIGELNVKILKILAEAIKEQKPELVVDGGCGTGIDACCLAMLFPDVHFTGYDISDGLIQIARERAGRRNVQNVNFILARHENIPLGNEIVDLMYMNTALVDDPRFFPEDDDYSYEYFAEDVVGERATEFYRVLKKNGSLVYTKQSAVFRIPDVPVSEMFSLMEIAQYSPTYSETFERNGFKHVKDSVIDQKIGDGLICLRK